MSPSTTLGKGYLIVIRDERRYANSLIADPTSEIQLGQIVPLISPETRIGHVRNDHHNHLPLNRNAVSRYHATLSFVNQSWSIQDLRSRNRTYLNNKALRPCELYRVKEGDLITITDYVFWFRLTPINPVWLTANVIEIASRIASENSTELHGKLGKALLDVGCYETIVLNSCSPLPWKLEDRWVARWILNSVELQSKQTAKEISIGSSSNDSATSSP